MRQTTPLNDGASEQVYLSLLEDIMAHGIKRQDRTGVIFAPLYVSCYGSCQDPLISGHC